jgi:CheY-like chemotaxis protein
MPKCILDVGNCSADHAAIRALLERHFDASVGRAGSPSDTLDRLRNEAFDLVLVNRKLDADYSDGVEIIHAVKADPQLTGIPCMLITDYPEHQDAAVAAGAERGFGKSQLNTEETLRRLEAVLGPRVDAPR